MVFGKAIDKQKKLIWVRPRKDQMKTIFRYTNIAALMAVFILLGAAAGMAQDPCADAEGQTALGDKFRAQFPDKSIEGRKAAIETGKQFMEKYGSCESAKELGDYLKGQIPKMEEGLKKAIDAKAKTDLIAKFNNALTAKNWDEVYASGKEILTKYGDEFRDVELALGTIGYDESYKGNFKYNEETLKFARQAIADLEAGKTFSANYGVPKDFVYKSKDNALGWMNLTIGYITAVAQKDKKSALPYFYKATQAASDTNKNPIPYEQIGNYYFDELDKLTTEITAMAADQKSTDTPEVAQQKVDAIKAKVALANGTAERAIDAFSRANNLGVAKAYKDTMHKNMEAAYKLRFNKDTGLDAWVAETMRKPFANPTTPVTPVSDPEPSAPATPAAPGAGTTTPQAAPAKSGTTPTKTPTPPSPTKAMPPPAPKVMGGSKPEARVKKSAVKKKAA